MRDVLELAQCAGNAGEPCRLPEDVPHAIGLVAIALWLVAVAALVVLALLFVRIRLGRRRARRARGDDAADGGRLELPGPG